MNRMIKNCLLIYLLPLSTLAVEMDRVLDAMQWAESRGGCGIYFVEDRLTSPGQLEALKQIANHVGHPSHRMRGSHAGAMGSFQLIPWTFWRFRTDGDGDGLTDPYNYWDSRATAESYLTHLIHQHHSLRRALYYYSGKSWDYVDTVLNRL